MKDGLRFTETNSADDSKGRTFRQGKPAGYDMDCLDYWLNGSGFSPDLQKQPTHPLCLSDRQTDTSSTT
jgi:hypothetical protein